MSLIKSEDSKKWINSFLAVVSGICGLVVIRFFEQMGEWFDLEAKVPQFQIVTQVTGILVALIIFVSIIKNKGASEYLSEVYSELVKVVWPNKDDVMKTTVGLVFALSIISGLFVLVDFGVRKLLQIIL